MQRSVSRGLAVLALVIFTFTALPASAAPRQGDSQPGFFERMIQHIVQTLEDIKGSLPGITPPPPAG
jgi:hypothetical protein